MSDKNRKGTCPVCSQPRAKNSCLQRGTREHCKGKNPNPAFIEIGQSSIGFPVYVSNSNYSEWKSQSDRVFGSRKPQTQRKPEAVVEPETKNSTPIAVRDAAYRAIPAILLPRHSDVLKSKKRGLNDRQIEEALKLGVKSSQPGKKLVDVQTRGVAGFDHQGKIIKGDGLLLPGITVRGEISAYQIARDDAGKILPDGGKIGKYLAFSSSDLSKGSSWQLTNGESPLTFLRHQGQKVKEVWLLDGYLKALIVHLQLLEQGIVNICVIGAPGANAILSPLQLKEAIDVLKPERIRLFPDAGDLMNPNVMNAHHKMYKAFCEWGCGKLLSIVWWGQFHKGRHRDADELGGIFPDASKDIKWLQFFWMAEYCLGYHMKVKADLEFSEERLSDASIAAVLAAIAKKKPKLIGIKGGKGFGKTHLIEIITRGKSKLVKGHRNQLMNELGRRLGVPSLDTLRRKARKKGISVTELLKGLQKAIALCVDSFHFESDPGFVASDFFDIDFITLDEIEQVVWHLLDSSTLSGGKRIAVLTEFVRLLKHWASPESKTVLIVADADLSLGLEFIKSIVGDVPTLIIENKSPSESYQVFSYDARQEWLTILEQKLRGGKKILIMSSSQRETGKHSTTSLERFFKKKYSDKSILRIDSKTLEDQSHPAYGCMTEPDEDQSQPAYDPAYNSKLDSVLAQYDIVICSPSLETGNSIDLEGHFDAVFGYFAGNTPESNARQALARLREPVDRHIFAAETGCGYVRNTGVGTTRDELVKTSQHLVKTKAELLEIAYLDGDGKLDTDFLSGSIDVWAGMAARINRGMRAYRKSLLLGLELEGCKITEVKLPVEEKALIAKMKEFAEISSKMAHNQMDGLEERIERIESSPAISAEDYRKLDGKSKKTTEQQDSVDRFEIKKRYQSEPTKEIIGRDFYGWHSALQMHFYLNAGRSQLKKRDADRVKAESKNGQIFAPDLAKATIADKIDALDKLGFTKLLNRLEAGARLLGDDPDLVSFAMNSFVSRGDIKKFLGIDITAGNKPHTVLGKFLDLVGLKKHDGHASLDELRPKKAVDLNTNTDFRSDDSPEEGDEGDKSGKIKAYSLATLQQLEHKEEKRVKKSRSAVYNPYKLWALDDGRAQIFTKWSVWSSAENLAQMREQWQDADSEELRQITLDAWSDCPREILQQVIGNVPELAAAG